MTAGAGASVPTTPTIAEAARLLETRAVSPVELTRQCLDRIAAGDGRLHTFLHVAEARAMADARAAEARLMAGERRGPLDGIPVALKDNVATAGVPTTANSRVLADQVPDRDAAVAAGLAEAGTVLLGKLHCYEFAVAGPSDDALGPPALNPWDTSRTTAGSSSGSAAAVAAGFTLGAVGTDSGGSIRDPAALCGVVGLKPTYGLCSNRGLLPVAWSLDHAGPMAWTAEDCALLLQAMAGYDPESPASARRLAPTEGAPNASVPDYAAGLRGDGAHDLRGLRIGVVRHFYEDDRPVSRKTQEGIDGAVAVYRGLGAEVGEVRLPALSEYHACGWPIFMAEFYAAHEARVRGDDGARGGRLLREAVALGGAVPAGAYLQAVRRRRELCAATAAAMGGVDLLLTAVQESEAPKLRSEKNSFPFEKQNFTMPFDVTGQPAISVCTGFGDAGLPVAMQLVARPFGEAGLLRAAHAYEAATPWRGRRPPPAAPSVVGKVRAALGV